MDLVVRECDVVFIYGVPSDEEWISQFDSNSCLLRGEEGIRKKLKCSTVS